MQYQSVSGRQAFQTIIMVNLHLFTEYGSLSHSLIQRSGHNLCSIVMAYKMCDYAFSSLFFYTGAQKQQLMLYKLFFGLFIIITIIIIIL